MRGSCPNTDEIRAALEHMAASEAFRGSPQLVAFLRYVVEETLRGASDRIKGYTIAVEALGRAENFDPQVDPIVRVEAMRLRRALARYYANGGRNDPVLIDLPLGSYVPAFRRAEPPVAALAPVTIAPPPVAAKSRWPVSRWPDLALASARGRSRFRADRRRGLCRPGFLVHLPVEPRVHSRAAVPASHDPPAYPVVFVGPIQAPGRRRAAPVDTLRGKLRDVLARFDEVQVVAAAARGGAEPRTGGSEKVPGASRYDLTASVLRESAGGTTISIRLTDAGNGRVVYARGFEQVRRDGELAPSDRGDRARGRGGAGAALRHYPGL